MYIPTLLFCISGFKCTCPYCYFAFIGLEGQSSRLAVCFLISFWLKKYVQAKLSGQFLGLIVYMAMLLVEGARANLLIVSW